MPPELILAADRSARRFDVDGRLHVELSNLSKACVNPYYGREIPDAAALGLHPDRIYQLYRDAEELATAAPTCNNIPLMRKHVAVSADDPKKDDIVGSTGTDATFDGTYLQNSLVIWDADAIADIESGKKCELSCGYRYLVVMEPGEHKGLRFDGKMTKLQFNHVALVTEGRAGPDVLVADAKPGTMSMKVSTKAIMLRGALASAIKPLLAADAKLDYAALVEGVTSENLKAMRPAILGRVQLATKDKLAADAKLDPVMVLALDAMEAEEAEDESDTETEEERLKREASDKKAKDKVARDKKAKDEKEAEDARRARDGESEEEKKAAEDAKRARDEEAAEKKAAEDKKAMDAAISKGVADGVKAAMANVAAMDEARRIVQPLVGELPTHFDKPSDIYKLALDAASVDTKGVPPEAFGAMVKMLPSPGSETRRAPLGMDSRPTGGWASKFGGLANIARS